MISRQILRSSSLLRLSPMATRQSSILSKFFPKGGEKDTGKFGATSIIQDEPKGSHLHVPFPIMVGEGGKAGEVPTDEEQSTGAERIELLSDLAGESFWEDQPLEVNRMGTMRDPIMVISHAPQRIVGSTGYPVDSCDVVWIRLDKNVNDGIGRCPESGCVYKLDYRGPGPDATGWYSLPDH